MRRWRTRTTRITGIQRLIRCWCSGRCSSATCSRRAANASSYERFGSTWPTVGLHGCPQRLISALRISIAPKFGPYALIYPARKIKSHAPENVRLVSNPGSAAHAVFFIYGWLLKLRGCQRSPTQRPSLIKPPMMPPRPPMNHRPAQRMADRTHQNGQGITLLFHQIEPDNRQQCRGERPFTRIVEGNQNRKIAPRVNTHNARRKRRISPDRAAYFHSLDSPA